MEEDDMLKKRSGKVLVLVLMFIAVVSILTASTMTVITRYQNSITRQITELRESVYDGD